MLKKESQKNWMKGHVVSNLPGRIRLEAEGLSNLFEQRRELAEAMAAIPGVTRARVTPAAQSVLLEYSRGAGVDAVFLCEQADLVLARFSMPATPRARMRPRSSP